MKDFQVIKILQAFSPGEMKQFQKFVRSPFYNTSEATMLLFDSLRKFYPHFTGEGMTRKKLFASVYGERAFSNELFNKLASNLIKLSLEYITVTNNSLKHYLLLRGLRQKKLYGIFGNKYKKAMRSLERKNLNEGDTVYKKLLIMENCNLHLDMDNYSGWEAARLLDMEAITLYFLEYTAANHIQKTNVALNPGLDKNRIITALNENIDYEKLYSRIERSGLHYKKKMLHYLSMILLHNTRDEKYYHEIKSTFFDEPLEEIVVINPGYIYLLDFITYKIKSGESFYLKERHLIYKKIETDHFASGRMKIIFTFFRNFILSGINTGDYGWSKYILNKYIDEIESKGNYGIRFYFEALISFHENNFTGSLSCINKVDLKKLSMDKFGLLFDIRFLKFKLCYELKMTEESLAMIDALEHYLKHDVRISKLIKPAYKGFLKYYKKLIKCIIKEDYSEAANIAALIQKENVHEKKWLVKKAEELSHAK